MMPLENRNEICFFYDWYTTDPDGESSAPVEADEIARVHASHPHSTVEVLRLQFHVRYHQQRQQQQVVKELDERPHRSHTYDGRPRTGKVKYN